MKQIVLGTAGHIDHGKTSLIKALSGIETDRLKEEKARGITIELGFASMNLPSGQHIGIVDVPGHERFIKNMVAGATGIDFVTMVIAADEGVMPQTKEHMEICTLLGIRHGLVVLTKVDMVDEEWLELVMEDVREFVAGTFLEGTPVLPVSSLTGQGIPELIKAIDDISEKIPARTSSGLFRLPVDRVFTMKGFGTVITGTVASGSIRVGEPIMIYPSGTVSKVRGIQVHNQSSEEAASGMRTAINFQGLEKTAINRGEVVSVPDGLKNSYLVDVSLLYLKSNKKPVKNRTRVRFHTGTSEIMGNLIILEKDSIEPGEETVAQIRLEASVACVRGDRFVLRSYSPVRTIAGGEIISPFPPKHKRLREDLVKGLKGLLENDLGEVISFHMEQAGYNGLSLNELKLMTNTSDKHLAPVVQKLLAKRILVQTDRERKAYLFGNVFNELTGKATGFLDAYHKANPLREGMSKEELKSKLPAVLGTRIFNMLVQQLQSDSVIAQDGDIVKLAGHKVALQVDQEEIRKKIMNAYADSGLTPPYFKALAESFGKDAGKAAKDVLQVLVNEKQLVKVKDDLYFSPESLEGLKDRVVVFLKNNGEMAAPDFKELTGGVSRKYLIPLLEYLDSIHLTIRVGDTRQLRGQSK